MPTSIPTVPSCPALSFHNVLLAYRHQIVLNGVSGHIDAGTLTAIVGANGCGKSTLIKAIAGIVKPASGEIRIATELGHPAYLSQISEIDHSFPVTVSDFVSCGLWSRSGAFNAVNKDMAVRIQLALEAVGMRPHANQLIGELSGGQFQRIRFAQLMLQNARLLLLDEPFTGIDEHTMSDLMRLLHHWHSQGTTILTVLHDMALVRQQFPNIIVLGQHKALSWGETSNCLGAYHTSLHPHRHNTAPAVKTARTAHEPV